ncbi:hypothetical protein BLNAU_2457 [Blattamonas nauphoetae]|uniref:Uncharacterized protein n=1 Tax=Blattamonas nauphoetae TaxID=2049346 RepID=A0ABQ9YFS3_9EUKA|nr:hypothetical protein BLNAU_2457 [Blattamonas nauphoetae]
MNNPAHRKGTNKQNNTVLLTTFLDTSPVYSTLTKLDGHFTTNRSLPTVIERQYQGKTTTDQAEEIISKDLQKARQKEAQKNLKEVDPKARSLKSSPIAPQLYRPCPNRATRPQFRVLAFGQIDKERRYQLACHHTATHLIHCAAHTVHRQHVWQTSAKTTVVQAHLDITHFAALKDEEMELIEDYTNKLATEELVLCAFSNM